MTTWLSKQEVMAVTKYTARTIERKVKQGEIESRISDEVSGNGRPHREYALSSLPPKAIEEYTKRELKKNSIIPFPSADLTQKESKLPTRILTRPEQEQQANYRRAALEPVLAVREGRSELHRTQAEAVAHVAKSLGKAERTIWNWLTRYDQEGREGLANIDRSDKNKSRFFSCHPAATKFVLAKYIGANEGRGNSIRTCYEALVREWDSTELKLSLGKYDEPPSYETVRSFLSNLPPIVAKTAREGDRCFNENFASYLQRDFEMPVNSIWVADHRLFDFFVYNDFFESSERRAAIRFWVTMIIDMRSRLAVGWAFSLNPSSDSISSALRMAIRDYGLPQVFYVDNGKDFKKLGVKNPELGPAAQGVLHKLGVRAQYCIPGHPQSKLVESFFSGLSKRFDPLFGDAYAGRKPALRPPECTAIVARHKRYLEGRAKRTELTPASEAIAVANQWFEEYNERPHSGRGMDGLAPRQIFERECPTVNAPDIFHLAQLFWRTETRKVMEGGTVKIFNERYQPIEGAGEMMLRIGTEVTVAYDPTNVGEAVVIDDRNVVIAKLEAEELVVHGPTSGARIRESMRARRATLRILKRYYEALSDGIPTEYQYLRRRAGYPTTIDSSSVSVACQPAAAPFLPNSAAVARKPAAAAPECIDDVAANVRGLLNAQETE